MNFFDFKLSGFKCAGLLILILSLLLVACGENTPAPAVTASGGQLTGSGGLFSGLSTTFTATSGSGTTPAVALATTIAARTSNPVTTVAATASAAATTAAQVSSSNKGPCSLVTRAELEAILGDTLTEPKLEYGGCTFYLTKPKPNTLAGIPWISVTWTHGTRANFDSAVKQYEFGTPAKSVSGLGDYAATASSFLFIIKGDNIVSIQPGNTEIPAQQIRDIASKALSRV